MAIYGNPEVRCLVELARAQLPRRTRAFERLVTLIYPDLKRIAIGVVGERRHAEQIVQDALLRVFHKLGSLEEPESFSAWVTTIVLNLARTFLAREKREREKAERSSRDVVDEALTWTDDGKTFAALIETLSIEERTIVACAFSRNWNSKTLLKLPALG